LCRGAAQWQETVRVIDAKDVLDGDCGVLLLADASEQQATIFVADAGVLSSAGPFPNRVASNR
jgi:hypothetical protein